MIQSTETSHRKVMVSGNFDPFHYAHLDYIKHAAEYGDFLICVVSSDVQVLMKKSKVNEPDYERQEIIARILSSLGLQYSVFVNIWDEETTLVAEALRTLKPDVFCRGTDKNVNDMPAEERKVCDELGIQIVHIIGPIVHGSEFV